MEAGSKHVLSSGETLRGIVTSVKRVTNMISEIAAASREQNTGIEQVNEAVTQMDQVTQSNAAQTEELSSTAQGLSGQSEQLQRLVARFRLDQGESGAHLVRADPPRGRSSSRALRPRPRSDAPKSPSRLRRAPRVSTAPTATPTATAPPTSRSSEPCKPRVKRCAQEVSEVILAETANVIELRGAVCGPVAQTLFHQARRLERHSAAAVRCDRLTSLDASALQVLLALHRTLQEHGHVLELRAVPPAVLGQLRAVGAADLLCISTEPIVEPEGVDQVDLEAATPTLPIAWTRPPPRPSPNETAEFLHETVSPPVESPRRRQSPRRRATTRPKARVLQRRSKRPPKRTSPSTTAAGRWFPRSRNPPEES